MTLTSCTGYKYVLVTSFSNIDIADTYSLTLHSSLGVAEKVALKKLIISSDQPSADSSSEYSVSFIICNSNIRNELEFSEDNVSKSVL